MPALDQNSCVGQAGKSCNLGAPVIWGSFSEVHLIPSRLSRRLAPRGERAFASSEKREVIRRLSWPTCTPSREGPPWGGFAAQARGLRETRSEKSSSTGFFGQSFRLLWTGRGRARVGLVLCGCILALSSGALGQRLQSEQRSQGRASAVPQDSWGLVQSWLNFSENPRPGEILFLKMQAQERAALRLLELENTELVWQSPAHQLAWVRALHAHQRGPQREAVLQILLSLFRERGGPPRAAGSSVSPRVRELAALSLAAAGAERVQRELWVQTQMEPSEAQLCSCRALRAHPPDWQSPSWDALREAWTREQGPPVSQQELLCSSATHWLQAEASQARWFGCLRNWKEDGTLPKELLRSATWEENWREETRLRSWRALALLAPQSRELRSWIRAHAPAALTDRSQALRAAAAFAWSVVAPEEAAALLQSEDESVRSAVLRQAHQGPLRAALEKIIQSAPEEWAESAWAEWLASERPARLRELRERVQTSSFPFLWLPALVAEWEGERLREYGVRGEELRFWLGEASPLLRVAVARGLSRAQRGAGGWLSSAYFAEEQPAVRRVLLQALGAQQRGGESSWGEVCALESDGWSRARFCQGTSSPRDAVEAQVRREMWSWAADVEMLQLGLSRPLWIWTIDGQFFPVVPEPDGFLSLVGLPFAKDPCDPGEDSQSLSAWQPRKPLPPKNHPRGTTSLLRRR